MLLFKWNRKKKRKPPGACILKDTPLLWFTHEWYPDLVLSKSQSLRCQTKGKKVIPGGMCVTIGEIGVWHSRGAVTIAIAVVHYCVFNGPSKLPAPTECRGNASLHRLPLPQAGRRRGPPLSDLTLLRKPPVGLPSAVGDPALSVVMERCRLAPRGGDAPLASVVRMVAALASYAFSYSSLPKKGLGSVALL